MIFLKKLQMFCQFVMKMLSLENKILCNNALPPPTHPPNDNDQPYTVFFQHHLRTGAVPQLGQGGKCPFKV